MRFASAAAVTSLAVSFSMALPLQTTSVVEAANALQTAPTVNPALSQRSGSDTRVCGKERRDNDDPNGHITDQNFQSQVLYHHNIHRANHSAPDVQWDDSLAQTALKIAQTCVYGHSS